jgi:hypothetical protein
MPGASSASGRSCIVERVVSAKKVASQTVCLEAFRLAPGLASVDPLSSCDLMCLFDVWITEVIGQVVSSLR